MYSCLESARLVVGSDRIAVSIIQHSTAFPHRIPPSVVALPKTEVGRIR